MYKLTLGIDGTVNTGVIIRLADNANIPRDPQNKDFLEFEAWVAAGNTPTPPDPPMSAAEITAQQRVEALARLDSPQGDAKALRSLLLAVIDALNELRHRFNDLQADVQSSANIAQVKPKWALRLPFSDSTGAGVKTEMQTKITSGAAD